MPELDNFCNFPKRQSGRHNHFTQPRVRSWQNMQDFICIIIIIIIKLSFPLFKLLQSLYVQQSARILLRRDYEKMCSSILICTIYCVYNYQDKQKTQSSWRGDQGGSPTFISGHLEEHFCPQTSSEDTMCKVVCFKPTETLTSECSNCAFLSVPF